jgi:hypothetical protein
VRKKAVYHDPGCGEQLPDCLCDGYETIFTGKDGNKYVNVKMPAAAWSNLMHFAIERMNNASK